MSYLRQHGTLSTPQSQPIPGRAMVRNEAGGYGFGLDVWQRLERFLILGTEGGTYYVGEHDLTGQNLAALLAALAEDGPRVVERIVEVSARGLAAKNDVPLFALAAALGKGDVDTRRLAAAKLPFVARTGTHLLHFAAYMEQFRGWGPLARRAFEDWFFAMPPDQLAYQFAKYPSRHGWAMRDLLRLTKPRVNAYGADPVYHGLFHWVTKGWESVGDEPATGALRLFWALEQAKRAGTPAAVAALVREYGLSREMLPTQYLDEPLVLDALLETMPLGALVRNLGNLTRHGVLATATARTTEVARRLSDGERLRRARLHPIELLSALKTYRQGHGVRGGNSWEPLADLVDALDRAFYRAFANVEPTGKRILVGLDVSGSMYHNNVLGMPHLTAIEAAAALALTVRASEPTSGVVAFDTAPLPLSISPNQRLDDVLAVVNDLGHGGTDCSIPVRWALERDRLPFDAFVVITDSQTWACPQHLAQTLAYYRNKWGAQTRLLVLELSATGSTVADTQDPLQLTIAGLDSSVPAILHRFLSGEL